MIVVRIRSALPPGAGLVVEVSENDSVKKLYFPRSATTDPATRSVTLDTLDGSVQVFADVVETLP